MMINKRARSIERPRVKTKDIEMGISRFVEFLLPWLLLVLQILPSAVLSQNNSLSCPNMTMCGDIKIPYPFSINRGCARDESFRVSCNATAKNTSKPFLGDMEISEIRLEQGEVVVLLEAFQACFNNSTLNFDRFTTSPTSLSGSPFTFSIRNKFVVTGCATTAYIVDSTRKVFNGACTSVCSKLEIVPNNTCSNGIGCCENSIIDGLQYFNIDFDTFYNRTGVADFSPCSHAFLVEEGKFEFNQSIITADKYSTMKLPVVIDWAIETPDLLSPRCEAVQRNLSSYACVSENSICRDASNDLGYTCNCSVGYTGNPYIDDGCQDINECQISHGNICFGICLNTPGSFECFCPEGTTGYANVTDGCISDPTKTSKLLIGLTAGLGGGLFLLLFTGASTLVYKLTKKRRKKHLRQKHFKQNHGLLLEQLITSDNDATERTKIFTLKELEKATNNFNSTRIIGDGGHGTVYKGMLLDQRVVAIKKSKLMEQFEIDQFINEVALLSRINHRNVVKIFGCCLESEVPLLVYEFIGNGTLTDHLHNLNNTSYLGWDDRLRIATEVAAAISYLHFASSKSIIHRDLKSSNILLDEKLTAKVADFGASKSVKSDETHITTAVQGTFGYLDPEYFQTGKLTDKSDVYGMGVILVELLTGQKPVSRVRAQEERNLIMHFIWLLQEKQISQIFEESVTKEAAREDLEVVAELAGSCLRLKGEERPSMKEVETTLEVLKRSRTKQKRHVNQEETESLLSYETPTAGGSGSRSATMDTNSIGQFAPSRAFLR